MEMININTGDKIFCSNGKTYTLIRDDDQQYPIGICDEYGEEINRYQDYALADSILSDEEFYSPLNLDFDYNTRSLIYVDIIKYTPVGNSLRIQ
jgi:hypothetical protein